MLDARAFSIHNVRDFSTNRLYQVSNSGLTRFFVKPVKHMSTKFIIDALKKLTVMVVSAANGLKKQFYSNFNEVNRAILADFLSET